MWCIFGAAHLLPRWRLLLFVKWNILKLVSNISVLYDSIAEPRLSLNSSTSAWLPASLGLKLQVYLLYSSFAIERIFISDREGRTFAVAVSSKENMQGMKVKTSKL